MVVAELEVGASVQSANEKSGDYAKVTSNGREGYVLTADLTASQGDAEAARRAAEDEAAARAEEEAAIRAEQEARDREAAEEEARAQAEAEEKDRAEAEARAKEKAAKGCL